MSYTFVDSLNKIASLLNDSNTGSSDMWPLDIRKKELNIAEVQFATDAKDLLGYMSQTLDDTNTFSLPADWIDLHILIVDNKVITNDREISLSDWKRYYNWAGTPPYYYYWTDAVGTPNINFIGSVDGKLAKLFYFKKPTAELTALTDISLHQEEFRPAIAYHAASELIRQIGKNQLADEYRAIYEANVIRADSWARKLFINKQSVNPDLGQSDASVVDRQGQGFYQ